MKERLGSSMPPHGRMPRGILRLTSTTRGRDHHWPDSHRITRQPARQSSADDPYHAGFNGEAGHTVKRPSGVTRKPEVYICLAEAVPGAIPGKEVSVIAELRRVAVTGEFIPQPTGRPEDLLLFVAKARIGYQAGFFTVLADGKTLRMRVENAAGPLQEVSVTENMPSYDPTQLVVEYRNGLIIASA